MKPDDGVTYRLTWWEATELLDHLSRRPDLWFRSDDNPNLWAHCVTGSDVPGFGLLLSPPSDPSSPYRMYGVQAVPLQWTPDEVRSYVSRLIRSWTTFSNREEISSFLQKELQVPTEQADFAAIAIEALEWKQDGGNSEPPSPPEQTELWERPPIRPSIDEPNHVGTFLLSGQTGWMKLRLAFGMLRIEASIRPRGTDRPVLLEGFVRPVRGAASDAAAAIGGWTVSDDPSDGHVVAQDPLL